MMATPMTNAPAQDMIGRQKADLALGPDTSGPALGIGVMGGIELDLDMRLSGRTKSRFRMAGPSFAGIG